MIYILYIMHNAILKCIEMEREIVSNKVVTWFNHSDSVFTDTQ